MSVQSMPAVQFDFQSLADGLPQLLWLTSRDGDASYVNPQWIAHTGLPGETCLGQGWKRALHADDAECAAVAWQDASQHRAPVTVQLRLRAAGGAYHWCRVQVIPMIPGDAECHSCCAIATVLQAELDLRDALRDRQLALQAAGIGLWSRERANGRMSWDDTVCRLFDLEMRTGRAGNAHDALRARVHPEDAAHFDQLLLGMGHTEEAPDGVLRVRVPGAGVRYLQVSSALVFDEEGHPARTVGVMRDVSQDVDLENTLREASLKIEHGNRELTRHRHELEKTVQHRTQLLERALEQAQAADRAKSAFLATTSHELRTPLNAIIGFSALMLEGSLGPVSDMHRQPLSLIRRSGDQLLELVKDILDITSIEAGNLVLRPAPVELRPLLHEQCVALRARADERRLELRPVRCDDGLVVKADRGRLGQVVRNLVANAITFTDRGYIEVRAEVLGRDVRIEVEDSGIGIPVDQQHKLFRPFQPITGQPGPLRQRTGLGLAITRRIVDASGGAIGVRSMPDAGSTFWVTLPLV